MAGSTTTENTPGQHGDGHAGVGEAAQEGDAGTRAVAHSDAATVRALKATVRPAVRTVRTTAARGSWPARSSSR